MSPADDIPDFSEGPKYETGVFDTSTGKYIPRRNCEMDCRCVDADENGIPVFGRVEERPIAFDLLDEKCIAFLHQQTGGRWCIQWYLRPPHPEYLKWASITAATKVAALILAKDKGLTHWVEGPLGSKKNAFPLP